MISVNLHRAGFEVVANDYDQFFEDFEGVLKANEKVINKLFEAGVPHGKRTVLAKHHREYLQEVTKDYPPNILKYLSRNFMFSARRAQFDGGSVKDFNYFLGKTDLTDEYEFLDVINQIQLDSLDWSDFIDKYNEPGTLIVLDPPYLNSVQKAYNNEIFFGLAKQIELLNKMKTLGNDFIFFNQIEEDVEALLDLYGSDHKIATRRASMAGGIRREDVLAYVRR